MVAENAQCHPWYKEPLGIKFLQAESHELAELLPKLYGYHLVFCGDPGLGNLVESSLISHRILMSPHVTKKVTSSLSGLQGELEAMPFRTETVDVVVLAHVLENADNPHEILREAHRILIPEGHLVITGFNPWSMWGMWHRYQQLTKTIAHGKLLPLNRLRDWLTLLNFQIVGGRMFYFRPPIGKDSVYQKLSFMEKWGQHACPFLGGAYTLLAVKRVVPVTPIRLKWRPVKRIWQSATVGLPKPTTRVLKNLPEKNK